MFGPEKREGSTFVKPCCPHQLSLLAGEGSRWSNLRDLGVDGRLVGEAKLITPTLHWSLLGTCYTLHESGAGSSFLSVSLCSWLECVPMGRWPLSVLLLVFLSAPVPGRCL